MDLIEDNTWIYLEDNRGECKIVKLNENKFIQWRKQKFDISMLINQPYNSYYKLELNKLVQVEEKHFYTNVLIENQDVDITRTNKELYDKNDSQKLTQEQIMEMKVQEDGEEIVKKIVSNSETFNQKTEYSQAKYLKKKKEKYIFCFQVKKCTLEYVHKNIFLDSPAKINYFRIDVFAIFLQLCGIKPKSEILLFDNTYGIALAGIAERLDGDGHISAVFYNRNKSNIRDVLPLVQLNLKEDVMKSITIQKDLEKISEKKYTHLIISGEFNYKEILDKYREYLELGGVLVIFSQFLEKLSEASEILIQSQQFSRVEIMDSFLRYYQVLENRTHPKVDMVAFGGYLLITYKMM